MHWFVNRLSQKFQQTSQKLKRKSLRDWLKMLSSQMKKPLTEKLNTLKESYFPKTVSTQTIEEEVDTDNKEVDVSGVIVIYVQLIQKSKPYE